MDHQFLEDTKCDNRKKCCNQLKIFPIYTVAFTVNEMYDKKFTSVESEDSQMGDKSASLSTLKYKGSNELTNSLVNNEIENTERSITSFNKVVEISGNREHENNINYPTSESLPNSIEYIKKPLKSQRNVFSKLKSKPKKCTCLVKIRKTYFKNKNFENNINKKLETYYNRAKNKCTNARKIQRKIFSDSILNAVSLTRILKKVLAKENLLDDIDKISSHSNHSENTLYANEASQHTLTRERSISSNNSDFNNKRTPSVIDLSNNISSKKINSIDKNKESKLNSSNKNIEMDKIEYPYKTDIIAVAVAHIENASILNYKKKPSVTSNREKFIIKESLTSAESYLSQTATETSTSSFEMLNKASKEDHLATVGINDSGVSSQTLTESKNVFDITSESDQFVIAKTSSYFRNDLIDSNITLTPKNDLANENEHVQQTKLSSPKLLKSTLLDTIINVGMFPKMTASIHDNLYKSELKDVIITEELRNSLTLNRLDNNFADENKYSKSIFKKSFNAEDDSTRQKSITLPNEETIKELLFNRDRTEKKSCSEEYRNYTPFLELWDKLTMFLEIAMKKLEEAITEKITQEMKKTLDRLDRYIKTSKGNLKNSKSEIDLKANIISTMESGESKSLQCGSIENNVLDELVKKINLEGLKVFKSPPLKLKDKCKISDGFFEVLKPTVASCVSNEKGNGDSVVASSEGIEVKYSKLQYLSLFVINIVKFFKENLLVITTVPLFCFALFLIYTFLVVIANI